MTSYIDPHDTPLHNVLPALFWFALSVILLLVLSVDVFHSARLTLKGTNGTAIVTEYTPERCGGIKRSRKCHYHNVRVQDAFNAKLLLDSQFEVGRHFNVIYIEDRTDGVRANIQNHSRARFFFNQFGYYHLAFLIGIVIFTLGFIQACRSAYRFISNKEYLKLK